MISLTTAGWRGRASAKGELSVLLYICRVLFLGGIGALFFTRVYFFGGGRCIGCVLELLKCICYKRCTDNWDLYSRGL